MSSTDKQKVLVELSVINNLIIETKSRFPKVQTALGLSFIQGELQGIETVKKLIFGADQ